MAYSVFRSRPGKRSIAGLLELKNAVRANLGLTEHDVVMIHELRCSASGCPVETTVVVLDGGISRRWHLPGAPTDLTVEQIQQAVSAPPDEQKSIDS